MSAVEIDEYLTAEKTCRVGTVGHDGAPHVTPLWFVWDGAGLWLNSVVASQRWANIIRDPRVSVVIDSGSAFRELRGVELEGVAGVVGDVPRSAAAAPEVEIPEHLWGVKYLGGGAFRSDGRHAWLRVTPNRMISWDYGKIASA